MTLPIRALPQILEIVRDASLIFVGDGTGEELLRKAAKSIGVESKVLFTGFVSRKEVFKWIDTADVVIVPLLDTPNNKLTIPTKLLEYLAVGRPIVATRLPGICELIEDGRNGLLYGVGSVDEFSQCVVRILRDKELAQRLALNARADSERKYSFESNLPKLISLYDAVISNMNPSKERSSPR